MYRGLSNFFWKWLRKMIFFMEQDGERLQIYLNSIILSLLIQY